MARKKKKNQDTSPLGMARKQQGSAANQKAKRDAAKTVQTGANKVAETAKTAISRGTQSSASQRTNNRSVSTPNRIASSRGVQSAIQKRQDPLGINRSNNRRSATTARQIREQRQSTRREDEAVKRQNEREWNSVKNKSREDQQEWFTQKANEAQERHARQAGRKVDKGTDNLATSAARAAYHGGKGALHSLAGAIERASLNDTYEAARFKAKAQFEGKSEQEAEKIGNEKAQKRQQERLAALREKSKIEQEKVEAIKEREAAKDKGPIPLRKMAVGAASFTGQRVVDTGVAGPYSLLSMGARVLEDERNSGKEKNDQLKRKLAESGQYDQKELDEQFAQLDRRTTANAYASTGIEMLSELFFQGAGLSKKYMPKGASGFLDRAAEKLTGNLGRSAAGRIAPGIGEETAEEWIANPVQAAVSNKLTGNRLQELQEDSVRRTYQDQAEGLKAMKATAADINSEAFLERAKEIYKESGASDEEASQIAELARDYFNADLTGDSKTANEKLNQITDILAGGENDLREKWTIRDALEVAGEMILSVGAEATPGAIASTVNGNQYKSNYGLEGVRKLAKVVENLDEEKSDRARAIVDSIDNGNDVSGTEVAQLMEWSNDAAIKAQDREVARDNMVQRKMRDEDLFVPIVDSEYNLAPATEKRFEETVERTADTIQDMGLDMSDADAYAVGDVVAAYETGTISAEQMNELNIENPENRAVFKEMTGIDLDQYTVKDSKGNVKVGASNIAMQKALFARAADNYMKSARIEQENWNDVERGAAFENLTSGMDGMGGVGIQRVLESVDPRNRGDFMLAGSVARRVYEHARLTNDNWDEVKKDFSNAFGTKMDESMRYVFEMAKESKAISENKYYGMQVKSGEKISRSSVGDTVVAEGKFTNDSERMLKGSEISTLTSVASTLGINVILTDNLSANENGRYDPNTRTIMLNSQNTMDDNLNAIFSHEVTHHLAAYAPDEYLKLSRLIMDRWYKADEAKFKQAIGNIQKRYKDVKGQDLSPEQALEEIIADNAIEFWSDENFAEDVCREEPSLAEAIINAIKNVLSKLRSILSSGNITDEATEQYLFDQIGVYDDAYRMYLNAYTQARQDAADQAIDEWQDAVNEESRYSVSDDLAAYKDYILNKRTNAARWTDDRIDSLIRENGAKANEEYSKAYAVLMDPKDFLKLTLPNDELELWNERSRSGESKSFRTLNEEDLANESQTPFLQIEAEGIRDDGILDVRVYGHEGRHRMRALMEAGIKAVPVVIRDIDTKYSKKHEPSMILRSQEYLGTPVNDNARVDVYNLVPIKESNRDELIQKFGGEADVRFSISDADYMDAVESGDMETAQRLVDEAAKGAGYDYDGWHGTDADFTEFNPSYISSDNKSGIGFYFAMDGLAFEYKNKIKAKIKINSPIIANYKNSSKDISERTWKKFAEEIGVKYEDIKGISDVDTYIKASDINKISKDEFLRKIRDITGKDGIISYERNSYISFSPENIKDASPVTYDNNGDVIPLSERFNTESEDIRFSISEPKSASARYEQGYKLSQKQFRSFYSAHKLNLRGQEDLDKQIADIKENGFRSATALSNVMPVSTNDTIDPDNMNIMQGKYGVREGETVLLVPKPFVDKDDRIKDGFVPRDYEVVTAEKDFQPYYELYSKAYDSVRFSLSEPVERVRDLIAVHNLNTESLEGDLKLGGLPMPSIAITKESLGHEKYGDVSLLFSSDTIDPEFFRSNQVFGGDAYTPTFPAIHYKANSKVSKKLVDMYYDESDKLGYDVMRPLYPYAVTVDETLDSAGGEKGIINKAKGDTSLMRMYLRINDKDVENVTVSTTTSLSDGEVESYEFWIKELGKDLILEAKPAELRGKDAIYHFRAWRDEHIGELKAAYEKLCRDVYGFDEELIKEVMADEKDVIKNISSGIAGAIKYIKNGRDTTKTEVDYVATNKLVEEKAKAEGYDAWVEDLFAGIEDKAGIRNNKDMYTPSGDRRSWESLHEPVTLENVVRQMKTELEAGSAGFLGNNPIGAAQKKYKSLDEIREDEGRLQELSEENYGKLREEAVAKLSKVAHEIYENSPRRQSEYGMFAGVEVGSDIAEALGTARTRNKLKSVLEKDYLYNISEQNMDDLMNALEDVANLPTTYFEAKPRRAVSFEEVKAAIVPNDFPDHLRAQMSTYGTRIYEYDSNVEGDRRRVVNEAASEQDIRFSITDSEGAELSEGQVSFFENSKNRDAEGRLKVMLHGTNAEFTEFDPSKAQPGTLGRAFYFSDSASHAGQYGNVGRYYLNLENPLVADTHDITRDQLRRFVAELADNEDYGIENYGSGATVDSVTDSVWGGTDFVMLRDLNLSCVGDFAESLKVFNRINGTDYDGIITAIETVAFYPQQIKRTDNLNPTLNKDTRYSITDSDGNELSDGQVDYFKDSQARDEQGRLIPMYHVTRTAGFTIFDPTLGFDETSISFSNKLELALYYSSEDGNLEDWRTAQENRYGMEEVESDDEIIGHYKVYLNMENPLVVTDDMFEEMDIYEWPVYAKANGYDGVIHKDFEEEGWSIYQVFSSSQISDTRNLDPTNNPDIRYSISDDEEAKSKIAYDDAMDDSYEALEHYEKLIDMVDPETYHIPAFSEDRLVAFYDSLKADEAVVYDDPVNEEDRVRIAKSKEDFYNSLNAKWQDRWTTGGEVLDIKSVKTDIRNLVIGVMNNSDTSAKYRNEIVKKTLMDVRTAFQLMKQDRSDIASYLLYHSAQRMMDNVEFYVDDTFNLYKDLKHYLRTTKISIGEEYWSDVDYDAFRKRNFGRLKLVKGSTNVDQVYQELQEMYPEWFDEDETMTPPDMLLQIEHVLDAVQPYKEAYSSEEAASLAYDIADELYDIMAGGREVRSLADQYKERYDRKTKAMKQRHAEAMLRMRKARDEGVKAERAKWRAREEQRKERQSHRTYFDRIQKSYDKLVERLTTNTKDKNIPEQYKKELAKLLSAFDLQTVGSKKREERTGHVAQKTIKMAAIREALKGIENRTEMFHINDAITDIIEELQTVEGQTIDELSVSELQNIDKMLRALLHEFNYYDSVRVGTKRQQAADIGHAQVDSALEHAKIFGAAKDYQNSPGWIDKILNLDEMTPAYMFRRIDEDNSGLGLMWKEIRRSFDKYVRNQNQLNDWVEEIVGKYHQKGIFWNKYGAGELTDWRSDNYSVEFTFNSGTVKLTPAQMMSLYCLSKRPQAYQHMIGAGIVVAPVSFNAKILSDVKGKANTALPVVLTDSNIKTIVSHLTPDQIEVADKLQELMATKMADWGNEASMDVLGIKLFNEAEYFPIKSDKAALEKDLNDSEFTEAIRNFGFTKAVQPGARNAIMIDDIFDVVTEHCNNMNLYNAYSAAINDFMKVYNYRDFREDGSEYTVQQAIAHAYSRKATTFIMTFLRDLNGNVSGRASGIEDAYNSMLGNAKKAAVFANLRVAAQQPTAITRAFAEIDPKYLKGIKVSKGAMKEMFEHCPIAMWKSWGYYDINMGKSIEDIMMNNGRWLEDKATELYGKLDNVTWTAIWQMVKAEMKDKHPKIKEGTDEYWQMCNERMSEIVDFTQVVDSPMHRSHAMRDKGFLKKTATSFMAEPTLTFNMIRDGYVRAKEAAKKGDKALASKIIGRTVAVALAQAVAVAGSAGLIDALRHKNPDKDDEDQSFAHLWWVNFLNNFTDEAKIWNKIYFIKDIASIFEGWENSNLALQGIQKFALGYRQLTGDPYARSSASWWENMADGIGYMFGLPIKTVRTGLANAMQALGIQSPAIEAMKENLDSVAADKKDEDEVGAGGLVSKVVSDSFKLDGKGLLGKFVTKTSSSDIPEPEDLSDEEIQEARDDEQRLIKIAKSAKNHAGDSEALWDTVSDGYTKKIQEADYEYIDQIRDIYIENGGDEELFDAKVFEASKKALKKTISYEQSLDDIWVQDSIKAYLTNHGMTEPEISQIAYKSDIARDLKVALKLGDEKLIKESLQPLIEAGLTREDFDRLWENRNRMDMAAYKATGRYKDQLKSTGNFIWPTNGTITSHFGYRNAPTAGASSNHPAIDIGAPQGTAVVAADGGVVIYTGRNGGYGNSVGIKHDNGMVTYYNHLYSWNVKVGDTVGQGQQIAQVGSTGISTGPHLDFKILDTDGNPVDPEKYLNS